MIFRDQLVNDLAGLHKTQFFADHLFEVRHVGLKKMALIRQSLDLRVDLTDLLIKAILFRLQFPVPRDRRQIDPAQDQHHRERDRQDREELL